MKAASPPLLLLLLVAACGREAPVVTSPPVSELTYVDEGRCRSCHYREHRDWTGSHHQLAMQEATEETVLADFDDASFERYGVTTHFRRRDGSFFVETDGPDGELHEYEVLYAFGIDPLQQYLVDFGEGRLQVLATCWDVKERRWFHLYDEPIFHTDPLHWTGPLGNWNYMCAECHVTGYDKGYDEKTRTFDSTWHALGVGCQACHGPGSAHVESEGETPLPTDLVSDQVEACARCHSRRDIVHAPYEHGTPFLDHYEPELLVAPLYFPDGQILDEVYVYGSFLQAKKHARGVRCTDCHDPHTAGLRFEGNDVCTQCHRPDPPERLPTLAKLAGDYDDPGHHHHAPGGPGSACVDCHMPETVYMQVDPRRDHGFKIPRPDLAETLGVPDACTGCHADRDAAWAARTLREWFPASTPRPGPAETLARARRGDAGAAPSLIALAADADVAPIVRATALRELRRYPTPSTLEAAGRRVRDDAPLVRLAALDLVGSMIPPSAPPALLARKRDLLVPSLRDPLRALRIEAARGLAGTPDSLLTPEMQRALADGIAEFRERQAALADRADAWLNLGALEDALGRTEAAEEAYREALEVDPAFIPVRLNLAVLLNRRGANDEAERMLREVIALMPEHGEAYYSLGLLEAERERYESAAAALSRAAALMPGRPRVEYNRAMVLQRLGRFPDAVEGLERAHDLDPQGIEIVQALVLVHRQRHDDAAVARWTEVLRRLVEERR